MSITQTAIGRFWWQEELCLNGRCRPNTWHDYTVSVDDRLRYQISPVYMLSEVINRLYYRQLYLLCGEPTSSRYFSIDEGLAVFITL